MATSPWYREGTAVFTQGSTTVTGTGTRWVDFVRAGDGIQGPDGKLYQVTNVASNTSMSITPAYGSETTYWTIPIQGYVKRLADAASQLVRDFEGGADEALDAADRAKQSATEASASEAAALSQANRAESEADRAETEADRAQQAADDAVAVTTGGTATIVPEAGKIPLARSDGKIDGEWVDFDTPSLEEIIDRRIYKAGVGASDSIGVVLLEEGGAGGTFAHINQYGQLIDTDQSTFNNHKLWGAIEDVIIDGQHMVRIPKFYIKTSLIYIVPYVEPKRAWHASLEKGVGFRVHPAFMKNGAELDQIYVGKYQASLEAGKLASLPGVLPAVSRNLTQFTNDALARNVAGVDGFMLWSIYQLSAIQMLFMIEHKTMDSQAAVGQGRVSTSSAAEVDAPDVATASYRGIVGLWGNVWQWCQGIRAVNGAISVWDTDGNQTFVDTPHKRAEDVAEIIYPIDFFDESGDSYDLGNLFVGKTGPESNTGATAPDYNRLRLGAGPFFCIVGGYWYYGSGAGLWALHVYYHASSANASLGARLAKA